MTTKVGNLLQGLWYVALPSRQVRPGQMVRQTFFAEELVFGRTKQGVLFCYIDRCPHRGAPLSAGQFCADGSIQCPYHGWRFSNDNGRCIEVPALPDRLDDISGIYLKKKFVHEENSLIWLYHGAGEPDVKPPDIGVDAQAIPKTTTILDVACDFDEAVIGLVDPAHTPTVHRQWWWRQGAARKVKTKQFEPTDLGFRMPAHRPSSNSRIYKMLGGTPTTEIEFRLPGIRLEWIRQGASTILGLTAMTPIEKNNVRINHFIFWDRKMLNLVTPFVQRMANNFIGQDGAILIEQNKNLSRAPHRSLYLGHPDMPAQWYFKLKKAWAGEEESFVNPLSAATLQWKT